MKKFKIKTFNFRQLPKITSRQVAAKRKSKKGVRTEKSITKRYTTKKAKKKKNTYFYNVRKWGKRLCVFNLIITLYKRKITKT